MAFAPNPSPCSHFGSGLPKDTITTMSKQLLGKKLILHSTISPHTAPLWHSVSLHFTPTVLAPSSLGIWTITAHLRGSWWAPPCRWAPAYLGWGQNWTQPEVVPRGLQLPRGKNEIKYSQRSLIIIRTIIQLYTRKNTYKIPNSAVFKIEKGNRKLYLSNFSNFKYK